MNKKIAKALNDQIVFEFDSAYLYLAMSLAMTDAKMPGFAKWLRVQYEEEMQHGYKLLTYLQERDETVVLGDIKASKITQDSALEIAKAVLAHEQAVSSKIGELYELAMKEKDFATVQLLGWFISEQVEEEANARDLIDQFTFAGDNKTAQLFVDSKLGGRQG